jgi:hypothetical protein
VLLGEAGDVNRPPFLYFSGWHLQCARLGSWKLHMSRGNVPAYTAEPKVGFFNLRLLNPELYNIDADPEEAEDVSAQHPEIVADIQQRVAAMLPSFPADVQAAWQNTQRIPVYPNEPGACPRPLL